MKAAVDGQAMASSSTITEVSMRDRPMPPRASGVYMPMKPISPAAFITSTGKMCSASHCAAWGAIDFSAKARAAARNANWSSVRLKSIVWLLLFQPLRDQRSWMEKFASEDVASLENQREVTVLVSV